MKEQCKIIWIEFYHFKSLSISYFCSYEHNFIFVQGDQGQRGPPGEIGPKGERVSRIRVNHRQHGGRVDLLDMT